MRAAIKFCGTCNPQIDTVTAARELQTRSKGVTWINLSAAPVDLVVILNACPTACADRLDVREQAERSLVVTSEMVNGRRIGDLGILQAIELALTKE